MTTEELINIDLNNLWNLIEKYKDQDPVKLSLKLGKQKELPVKILAEQITCLRKAKTKLPNLSKEKLLYETVALEQCSSEASAIAKSDLIKGKNIIDMTGGFAIDDIKFAEKFEKVIHCEMNEILSNLVKLNLKELGIKNIETNCVNSIEYLKSYTGSKLDWIYLDPARREGSKRSVNLEFCTPNVYDNLKFFFSKSNNIMIKAAPAFDIKEAERRFPNLYEIVIVSVDNECKEVLLLLSKEIKKKEILIKAVLVNGKTFEKKVFNKTLNDDVFKKYSKVKKYFYEPDSGIIKSGLSALIANKFNLSFLNDKCDFLTSEELVDDFPGRSFMINNIVPFKDKVLKKYFEKEKIKQANIAKRGFRLSVNDIRKRLKLKEGGNDYLFFTVNQEGDQIMIHSKK